MAHWKSWCCGKVGAACSGLNYMVSSALFISLPSYYYGPDTCRACLIKGASAKKCSSHVCIHPRYCHPRKPNANANHVQSVVCASTDSALHPHTLTCTHTPALCAYPHEFRMLSVYAWPLAGTPLCVIRRCRRATARPGRLVVSVCPASFSPKISLAHTRQLPPPLPPHTRQYDSSPQVVRHESMKFDSHSGCH